MISRDSKISAVELYSEAFRDLVNECVGLKGNPASRLRLSSTEDWSFVCVAMDILGDASLALHNFVSFGLDGPTKYNDTGERYLRLYGLLSAAYVQQQAALKLQKLMNCTSQKEFKSRADQLQIRLLRHQLASHSLDFADFSKRTVAAFVPVRFDLGGYNCTVTENRGDRSVTYNLRDATFEHCDFMVDLLDMVYEKSYRTLFKANKKKQGEHMERLKDLRLVKAGHVLMRGADGKVLRVIFAPAKEPFPLDEP